MEGKALDHIGKTVKLNGSTAADPVMTIVANENNEWVRVAWFSATDKGKICEHKLPLRALAEA